MKEVQGSTPESKHPEPTPSEDDSGSQPNNSNGEQNRNRAKTSAFDELLQLDNGFFRKESKRLAGLAARMGLPLSENEDAVQEGWMSGVDHRNQFAEGEIEPSLHCLLKTVVRRKVVDAQRHRISCPCQSLEEGEIEPSDDYEIKRVEMAELQEELDALLARITPGNEENMRLLRAHYFQGLSIEELARQFSLTAKAVDGRIRRLVRQQSELAEGRISDEAKDGGGSANCEEMKKIGKSARKKSLSND